MTNQEDQKHDKSTSFSTPKDGGFIEIRVRGHLDESWSEWLEGLEVKLFENGEMILYGPITDQPALMGILNKLYRLNLVLLSVKKVEQKSIERNKEKK